MRAQLLALAREGDRTAMRLLAELDSTQAESDFAALRRRLSGHTVTIRTALDRSVGASVRLLAQLDTGVARLTGNVTAHTATVGAATLKYAAFAGVLAQAIGLTGGLGAAAATASGSLLVLPAVGIAAAVAVRTLKLGVDGLNEALSADTPAEYAEAVKDFPPAMRETTDAVRALRPELDGLKLDVRSALFANLGGEVTALGGTYLPVLRSGLTGISDGFNLAAKQAAGFAREGRTVADVGAILDNTGRSVRALAEGTAPLLRVLRDVVAVGSEFLPGFAEGFADGAGRLAEFIAAARETGQLREWMSAGLSALGELLTLLGNLARIVVTVFSAANAGGAGLLTTLNALTGSLLGFLRSAEGTVALQQIFGGLGAIASGLLPLFEAVGRALAFQVAPAVAQLGPMVAVAFGTLAQAAVPAGQILAALAPLAGTAAQALASLLVPALGLAAGVVAELAPAVQLLASELVGGALPDAVRELSPALIGLARAAAPLVVQLGKLLVQAVQLAAPALANFLRVITPIAVQIGGSLLTAVAAVLPLIGQLAALWADVLLAGLQAALPVLPVAVMVIQQLASVLSTGLAAAQPTLVRIGQLLGETLAVGLQGLLPLLPPLVEGLLRITTEGLIPLVPPLLELTLALLPSMISLVEDLMPVVVQATGVLAVWTGMIARVAAEVSEKLAPVLRWLMDNVVGPTFRRIRDTVSGALTFLQGILDTVMGVITGDWSRAWSGVKDIVSGAWQAIVSGADLATGGLVSFVASLPGRLLGALGDLGSLLVEAGKNLIRGLLRGIESMINSVRDKLQQLTNLLPSWKGPPERDRNLLRRNGSLVMRGFLGGLQDEEPAVRDYLTGLTRRIPLTFTERDTPEPSGASRFRTTVPYRTDPAGGVDLSEFVDAVRELASRPVVVQVGATEIARATAEGERVLARR
ncbi:phage tail protein [Actinosynnema sp. CA-248983]